MKLATTTVSYEGYAEEAWKLKRLSVAKRAIEKARNLEAQVLVCRVVFLPLILLRLETP